MGKMAKISPKIDKIEIWQKSRPKEINSWNKSCRGHIWECLNNKSGLRILIWPFEVPFFGLEDGQFWRKWVFSDHSPLVLLWVRCALCFICVWNITIEHDDVLQYSIRVTAENSVGEGEPSSKQTVKTLSEAPEGIIDQWTWQFLAKLFSVNFKKLPFLPKSREQTV